MDLKRPTLAPRLSDHLIAAAIEELANKGSLVKLPEPELGMTYGYGGGQPGAPTTYTVLYNEVPSHARKLEAAAEEERCCIECHYWYVTETCPRQRYSFGNHDEVKGNITTTYVTRTLKEGVGPCSRCWES